MNAYIITIGKELLTGEITNSNATWIADCLTEIGIKVSAIYSIDDDEDKIINTLHGVLYDANLTIVVGGLGITPDDKTYAAIAQYFKVEQKKCTEILERIKQKNIDKNKPLSKMYNQYGFIPDIGKPLYPTVGYAPALWIERHKKYIAVLPGVPREMKSFMKKDVIPILTKYISNTNFSYRYIVTSGITEVALYHKLTQIDGINTALIDKYVGFRPSLSGVILRISKFRDERILENNFYDKIGQAILPHIVSYDKNIGITQIINTLLRKHKLNIATAESCTTGLLCHKLSEISGSSTFLKGSIVAYNNTIKEKMLHVPNAILKKHGAVSKEVALIMAKNVAHLMQADIGISLTGVAGPSGGTKINPVGTVWIGFFGLNNHFALRYHFFLERHGYQERSCYIALDVLKRIVCNIVDMPYNAKKCY